MIENYRFRSYGDYAAWPGPNSNTFVQAVLDSVPELRAVLPPTAIGKDFPYNGRWIGVTSSGTGVYLSLAGYFGMTIGWVEGFELNLFGAVVGFDVRRPALKLLGLGRLGVAAGPEEVIGFGAGLFATRCPKNAMSKQPGGGWRSRPRCHRKGCRHCGPMDC